MDILVGNEVVKVDHEERTAIIEFKTNDYSLYAFQGNLSDNDILIKYRKNKNGKRTRIRTPKHIHWVVDVLMKMQANKGLTKDFLAKIKNIWDESFPLSNNDYNTLKELIENKSNEININNFISLTSGEYNIEFLYTLITLLIYQEKTNRHDSYLVGNILDAMNKDDLDIFSIISTATLRKR